MRGEKEIQSTAVHIPNWVLTITYHGKAMHFDDSQQERLKLVVTSPARSNQQEYMNTFEVSSLAQCGIIDPKDFKTLKEFFYYLKFNGEQVKYRQLFGEAQILVQYLNMRKEKPVAHINHGRRFIAEPQEIRQQRVLISLKEEEERQLELQRETAERKESVYGRDALLVERLDDLVNSRDNILTQQAHAATKIIVRTCEMDVNSEQCQMKNDREIDRLAIDKIIHTIPQLNRLETLSIQWHKLSTLKTIKQIISACAALPNLRVLNFDNQGNALDKSSLAHINSQGLNTLKEVTCYFNITDQDEYFEQSWWFPEHTEKYKGRQPLPSEEWLVFMDRHREMEAVWVAKGGRSDIELMMRRSWGKLALGYFLDQKMDVEYWKALKAMPSENPPILQSLCLTRIKNIDNEALKTVILANWNTLQHFALKWCDNQTDDGLSSLQQCKLKFICLQHSPLQESNVHCSFLRSNSMAHLQTLHIDNFKQAKQNILNFLDSQQSSKLRSLSLPRNQWVGTDLWSRLGQRPGLTKLNLYKCRLLSRQDFSTKLTVNGLCRLLNLEVLNLGATDLQLQAICQIVKPLKRLRKLNISDRKIAKTINAAFYNSYPLSEKGEPKPYQRLSTYQKKEFMTRVVNGGLTELFQLIPRVTHLDIRNLGCDERPFANLKLLPRLRFLGCEFELYKQVQSLDRRGLTFV